MYIKLSNKKASTRIVNVNMLPIVAHVRIQKETHRSSIHDCRVIEQMYSFIFLRKQDGNKK